MKIDELLEKLTEIRKVEGNIEVEVFAYDGQQSSCSVERVKVLRPSNSLPYVLLDEYDS
jgi:hypothetical protein